MIFSFALNQFSFGFADGVARPPLELAVVRYS